MTAQRTTRQGHYGCLSIPFCMVTIRHKALVLIFLTVLKQTKNPQKTLT